MFYYFIVSLLPTRLLLVTLSLACYPLTSAAMSVVREWQQVTVPFIAWSTHHRRVKL